MHNIVIGLMFGDETKGATVDYLCSLEKTDFVVRFTGGPQTAHNVITPDGHHHTFSQFGSGTLQNVETIMSRFTLINPLNMVREAEALEKILGYNPLSRNYISEDALLITTIHRSANYTRELQRGGSAHGSCGQGIGEAMLYSLEHPELALHVKDLKDPESLRTKVHAYSKWITDKLGKVSSKFYEGDDEAVIQDLLNCVANNNFSIVEDSVITQLIATSDRLVFEGTQGVLLDEWYGFHPHTTWSTTTPENAITLLKEAGVPRDAYQIIGALRTYGTRHGHGPFPAEHTHDSSEQYVEPHNKRGVLQGAWRIGDQDVTLLKYAIAVSREVDGIALSHCDVKNEEGKYVALEYDAPLTALHNPNLDIQEEYTKHIQGLDPDVLNTVSFSDLDKYIDYLEQKTGIPIVIKSFGPSYADRQSTGKLNLT